MKKPHQLLLLSASLFAFNAHAIPNIWHSGFGQGITEYAIESNDGAEVLISCAEGYGGDMDNSVSVSKAGNELRGDVQFLIDGEAFAIPEETATRGGSSAWINYFLAISKASAFEVFVNNKSVGAFSPAAKNVSKTFQDATCHAKWDWDQQ